MRVYLPALFLLVACSGEVPGLDGAGGGNPGTGGDALSGGASSGGAGTGGSTGGELETGGMPQIGGSGGQSSGGTSSGGSVTTGGDAGQESGGSGGASGGTSTGGSPATGGALALDACSPPELTGTKQGGDDVNGYCGWTVEDFPDGYGPSPVTEADCDADRTFMGLHRDLATDSEIQLEVYVAVIDPADRCPNKPDRNYTLAPGHCSKFTNPFGATIDGSVETCLVVRAEGTVDTQVAVFADEPSWVQVDTAEMSSLVNGTCPLACD